LPERRSFPLATVEPLPDAAYQRETLVQFADGSIAWKKIGESHERK